jgi:hypothetical protein
LETSKAHQDEAHENSSCGGEDDNHEVDPDTLKTELAKRMITVVNNAAMSKKGVLSSAIAGGIGKLKSIIGVRLEARRKDAQSGLEKSQENSIVEVYDHREPKSEQIHILHHLFWWMCYLEIYDEISFYIENIHLSPFLRINYNDSTCVHLAAGFGKDQLLKFFYEKNYHFIGGNECKVDELLNLQTVGRLMTPLHEATANKKMGCVEYLVEKIKSTYDPPTKSFVKNSKKENEDDKEKKD